MLVSELTRTKMFTILSDSSQNVSLDEMKLAYQDFVEILYLFVHQINIWIFLGL